MGASEKPPSFQDFDRRLKRLQDEGCADKAASDLDRGHAGLGTGMQVGIELVGGTIAGVLIGLSLDYWLGTRPLMLALFVILGAVAGMLNAHRYLRRLQASDEAAADKATNKEV